jgi:tetratricopeptide (TPR) repeat protein
MKPQGNTAPSAHEVREALRRILVSPAFSHAPQLGAFLRFVVESVLAGEGDHIKSYTIAVEALGRNESFDPKADPIVRVEAGRVRRALSRYYAGNETGHAVIIELPVGSYVPVFHRPRRSRGAALMIARFRRRLGRNAARSLKIAAAGAVVLVAVVSIIVVRIREDAGDRLATVSIVNPPIARAPPEAGSGPILPIVSIQPFDVIGASPQQTAGLEMFRSRLRDALARFDEIEVVADGTVQPDQPIVRASTYRLAGLAEFGRDGDLNVSLWLTDAEENTIVWTQTFHLRASEGRQGISRVVQQVATKLAQPYGVIYARELADPHVDPRYKCTIGAFEYRRGFKRTAAEGLDACLEQVTARNPAFADGFALQALRTLHRYYDWQGDSAALLEQAMMLAQKAVDLKPQSARARQALMTVLFARREIAAAFTEGEVAISLNPNDMIVLHAYGLLLLIAGQPEKGAALVRQAAALTPVRPAGFEFSIFLSAYLLGDDKTATDVARLFTNNDYQLLLVARAVSAVRAGDTEQSRRAVERLMLLHPAWRNNARKRLERYFPSQELVDRLMNDLTIAGLFATQ